MKAQTRKKIASVCNQSELARRMKKTPQTINGWIKGKIPAELVFKVSQALNFAVTPHELRPDLYPNPTDALPQGQNNSEAA